MKIKNLFKKEKEFEVSFYDKENEEHKIMLARQDIDHYTKNIKVKDVKTYLQEEYDRAFKREELITTLTKRIEEYEKLEQKYEAMLVVQEKREERYKQQEKNLIDEKNKTKDEKEKNKELSSRLVNATSNCKKAENELNKKIREQDLLIHNAKQEAKKEVKVKLAEKITSLKGNVSKKQILDIINGNV